MKPVLYFKKWTGIPEWGISLTEFSIFGQRTFSHHSNKVPSGTDESLDDWQRAYNYDGFWGWIRKYRNWHFCMVLEPIGDRDTMFKIGYCDSAGCKIAPVERFVGEGLFAMRVGPKECDYFVIGDKKISLRKVVRLSIKSREAREGEYKEVKIY